MLPFLAASVSAFAADLPAFEAPAAFDTEMRHRPPPHRPPPPPRQESRSVAPSRTHAFTLDISALDLAYGVVDLGGEFRLDRQGGLLLEGAVGSDGFEPLYRVGVEARRYVAGDFDRGVFVGLGAELGNVHFLTPVADAIAVGPAVGAKLTLPSFPLTLSGSVGADLVAAEEFIALAPTARVGVGFSF